MLRLDSRGGLAAKAVATVVRGSGHRFIYVEVWVVVVVARARIPDSLLTEPVRGPRVYRVYGVA